VTIREPRGIIEAVGLELDNKTKTLKLKSRVSGTFEPSSLPSK
jgi:lipopolysaccharide export system protein LptC